MYVHLLDAERSDGLGIVALAEVENKLERCLALWQAAVRHAGVHYSMPSSYNNNSDFATGFGNLANIGKCSRRLLIILDIRYEVPDSKMGAHLASYLRIHSEFFY